MRRHAPMVERIYWDCEVVRDYSATNMGRWKRIASGITAAFKEVRSSSSSRTTVCRSRRSFGSATSCSSVIATTSE